MDMKDKGTCIECHVGTCVRKVIGSREYIAYYNSGEVSKVFNDTTVLGCNKHEEECKYSRSVFKGGLRHKIRSTLTHSYT